MLSICGVNCHTDCRAYKTECEGCNELSGKVSWAEFYGTERCPIFAAQSRNNLVHVVIVGLRHVIYGMPLAIRKQAMRSLI